ncbi:hypothetical protein [Sorangium sp. So ce124]
MDGQPIIDTASLAVDHAVDVTGLVVHYEAAYAVAPRQAGDLVAR